MEIVERLSQWIGKDRRLPDGKRVNPAFGGSRSLVRFDRQSPGGHVSVKRLETFGGVVSTLCLKDGTIVSFFVSSLTDDIFVLKYSAYIQTSTSPPPLQWPPVLAFLSTRSCDSCEVGEDGMEELV